MKITFGLRGIGRLLAAGRIARLAEQARAISPPAATPAPDNSASEPKR